MPKSGNPFLAELIATARKMATPGKGILAADESTGTIGKRFKMIKDAFDITVENNEENRRVYRELLFTTEGLEKYICGVILFEESTKHATKSEQSSTTNSRLPRKTRSILVSLIPLGRPSKIW